MAYHKDDWQHVLPHAQEVLVPVRLDIVQGHSDVKGDHRLLFAVGVE